MEREANYAAVGAFVLIITLIGGLFVYWYSDTREHKSYQRYEIYFAGSVSGLDRGSAVRYLGVNVGRVVDMRVDTRDASRVQVIADIDSSAPISADTAAELSLQGVTGLLYIDLLKAPDTRALGPAVASLKYPVIRSVRSNFDVFLASLPEVVAATGKLVERASQVLSDRNINSLTRSFDSIEKATAGLPDTLRQVNALVADLRRAAKELTDTAASTRGVVEAASPEIVSAVQHARVAADHLAEATGRLDKMIDDNRQDIRSFTRDGLSELERFLQEGRAAAEDIKELSRSLRDNPSQLIYQPPERGVEVPR